MLHIEVLFSTARLEDTSLFQSSPWPWCVFRDAIVFAIKLLLYTFHQAAGGA